MALVWEDEILLAYQILIRYLYLGPFWHEIAYSRPRFFLGGAYSSIVLTPKDTLLRGNTSFEP